MVKEITSLKPEFKKLERDEPWTKHEKTSFPARQKMFIRGIQVTHGMKKQDAIDYFGRMNLRSKDDLKSLEKTVKKRLEKYASSDSGGKKTHVVFTTDDLKRERAKLKKQTIKSLPRKEKLSRKQLQKEKKEASKLPVKEWLNNKIVKATVSDKVYKRVLTASKKYPNASKFELQHGVNSAASIEYRKRHKIKENKKYLK